MGSTSKSILSPLSPQATLARAEKHTEAPYQPVLCKPLPSQASCLNLPTQASHIEVGSDDAISKAERTFHHARVELARQRKLACSSIVLDGRDYIFEDTLRRKSTLLDLFGDKRNLMIICYAETIYENLFDLLASYLFPYTSLVRVSSSLCPNRSFIPCYMTNSAIFTTPGVITYHLSYDGLVRRVAMVPFIDFFSLSHLLGFIGDFEDDTTDKNHSAARLEHVDEKMEVADNDDEAVVNAVVRWIDLVRDLEEAKKTIKSSVVEKESKKKKS